MKYKNNSIINSMTMAAILMALIIVLDFSLEYIKIFNYSIQVFLIFYAIGILWIKNWQINIFFFISCPIILFFIEQNPYIINWIQVIYEYFLVFYIFGLFYILKIIFANTEVKNNNKNKLLINICFITLFTILIFLKYVLHSIASLTWWGKHFVAAFLFNVPWLVVNLINIPILISIIYPISWLIYHYQINQNNYW